jgi:hypothetical protein
MWYTILLSLVIDLGGLVLVYLLLRDRVRRAVATETRIGEIREEVSHLLVELNQATDRNIALMEDRITALNDVIATADKKIGLLRRETEKHDVGSQIYSRLAEGRPSRAAVSAARASGASAEAAGAPPGPTAAPPRASGAQRVPTAPRAAEPVVPRGSAPPLSVELSEKPSEETGGPPESGDVRQRVLMLYRSGFSPSLIASRVGAPRGEVELIISLEQRKGQA